MLAPEFPSVTSLGPGYAVGKRQKKAKKRQKKVGECPFPVHRPACFAHHFFFCFVFVCFFFGGSGGRGRGRGVKRKLLLQKIVEFLSCEQTALLSATSNDSITLWAKLVICLEGLSRGFD